MDDTLRAKLRHDLFHATGVEPADEELDIAVRREFAQLSQRLRRLSGGSMPDQTCPEPVPSSAFPQAEGMRLDSNELKDAEAALTYAKTHRVASLLEAVRWYHLNCGSMEHAPLLPQCVDEFLSQKRAEGRANMTIFGYKSKLDRFAAAFAGKRPTDVSPSEIGRFIALAPHQTTRRDWWQTLSLFYRWCVGQHYALADPLPQAMLRPRRIGGAGLVLTPGEARQLLHWAKRTDEIGFWALSLFAGLRTEEIRRLQAEPERWSLIRIKQGVIELPERLAKTGARKIQIMPVLNSWLEWVRDRDLPIFPPNHYYKCRRLRQEAMAARCDPLTDRHRKAHPDVPSPIWGFNVGRRSFITYKLALAASSYAEIARESGNSETIIRTNYDRGASRDDAVEFFSLSVRRV
jgi:hypothetical protein